MENMTQPHQPHQRIITRSSDQMPNQHKQLSIIEISKPTTNATQTRSTSPPSLSTSLSTSLDPHSPKQSHPHSPHHPNTHPTSIPFVLSTVQAGFPSPAEDYVENSLDLNELVVKNPTATFFVRVEGDSMTDAGILSGDILVVDRSIEPKSGKIIVAVINGEFTVKRLIIETSGSYLVPENPKFPRIKINPESDFQIWGTVTFVIHKTR